MADKGYHSRETLKDLDGGPWRSRIAEAKPKGVQRWHGDDEARRAVYGNRARLRSGVAKEALKLRAERVERSFEHVLDRGGLRRTHLRGRANVQKRYLLHVAGFNLGLMMRLVLGAGTPKELAARGDFAFWLIDPDAGFVLLVIRLPHRPFHPTSERSGPMDRDTDLTTLEPQTPPSSTACYAPEHNPDEYLNNDLKQKLRQAPQPSSKDDLVKNTRTELRSIQRRPARVRSYFRPAPVQYAA